MVKLQSVSADEGKHHYRTIWVSDVHLGSKGCQAEALVEFLNAHSCEYLYLVGDIFDLWALKRSIHWPKSHNEVIRTLIDLIRAGTKVIYIPGNHDARFRDQTGLEFNGIIVKRQALHVTADGRYFLVLHGDEFDSVVQYSQLVAMFGGKMYELLLQFNQPVNEIRSAMGFPYWSLSKFVKSKVKNAVSFISDYEKAVAREASRYDIDGVICGHIHQAEISSIHGLQYCNCGDWVESCTALAEDQKGQIKLIYWHEEQRRRFESTQDSTNTHAA